MTPKALVAHPGTQYSHSLVRELHRAGMLAGFHTGVALGDDSPWAAALDTMARGTGFNRQFQNRLVRGVPDSRIHRYPLLEIGAWSRARLGGSPKDALRKRNDAFQRAIPDEAIGSASAVVGFDTSSLLLAERARAHDTPFILDRSIGHPRSEMRVADALRRRFPDWQMSNETKSDAELVIEDREHELAATIVVPSEFTAGTLVENGIARTRILVNPFGTDIELFHPAEQTPDASTLVFLFVGAISARKGVPLLLDAWRRLRPANAELWVAGPGEIPASAKSLLGRDVRFLGPVARRELPDLMRRSHVFVFPSFFEGLAQVQIEAAASALPIIATPASGGEDVVVEGKTGHIIETGNAEQLVERIEWLATHRDVVLEMRANARNRANQWSWRSYGERWQALLTREARAA